MAIDISKERKAQVIAELCAYYQTELDENLSPFRAEQLLDFLLRRLGPAVYNQAVQDARGYMQSRLDDLEGEVFASESF